MSDILILEVITEPRIRPKQIKEVGGILSQPKGMDSTVYRWTNLVNGRIYIGIHKETTKAYWTSSTDKDFKKELTDPESSWRFEILLWGSISECRQYEYEILTENDARNNPIFYNKSNGTPGVKQIDYDKVKNLSEDIDAIRFNTADHEFKVINKSYLSKEPTPVIELRNRHRIQTRANEYIRSNLNLIKSRVALGIGRPHPVVLLQDINFEDVEYDWMVISGNHTIKAYFEERPQSDLPTIVIPPHIHENFTNAEIRLLSNELNRDKSINSPFSKEDAIKECLDLHDGGNSWRTVQNTSRLIDNGLTANQVKDVYNKVDQEIINRKKKNAGMVIMDWKGEHGDILSERIESIIEEDENTFVTNPYSSSALKMDKIYYQFHVEQSKRIKVGLPVNDSITCMVYHSSVALKEKWSKDKEIFEYVINKEGMTPMKFVELEMYMEDRLLSSSDND